MAEYDRIHYSNMTEYAVESDKREEHIWIYMVHAWFIVRLWAASNSDIC